MADNINLIPAAELPLTEAEEVEVLCVEGGELKRKAAANLGGGGGYVIHVPIEDIQEDGTIIISESFDNFAPVLLKGGSVWVDMSQMLAGTGMGIDYIAAPVATVMYSAAMGGLILMMQSVEGEPMQIMCPNGTWPLSTEG